MKVSKIPGLGRFGVFIDDVDFSTITDEEWMEIGKIHLNSLVTIIRNTKLDKLEYMRRMHQWGTARNTISYSMNKKYHSSFLELADRVANQDKTVEEKDAQWVKGILNVMEFSSAGRPMPLMKVTGKRDADGNPLGMFAEGELLWHSNESGTLTYTPGVSLLGHEGMIGSATGFVTTADWYELQSESFRSELDQMVLLHRFTEGKINPGLRREQDLIMEKNMCPVNDTRIPLVIQSPAGIKGLHYSVNTIDRIEGMSKAESDKLLARIDKELFTDERVYDHWYTHNDDLCLFDNSITLHRRLGGIADRLAYRIQYDYTNLQDGPWVPYFQDEFAIPYKKQIKQIVSTLDITDFKLPKLTVADRIKDLFLS